ncbi:FAD-binding oxidoreductase [Streptomyces sp. NPDC059740]|uniref:FAD-binding oxidoreductase n=1 Tax=Streptomyces sp. NPDC059740 TaxID=3346926 RepID=UPI003666DFA9
MNVSRRSVLSRGARVAAAAGVSSLSAGVAAASGPRTGPDRGLPESAWRDLARSLSPGGRLHRPGDAAYVQLGLPDNRRYASVQPAGIAVCATEADVQAALRWATSHRLPFAPRSGGHNYAGYSTTTGLLISLRRMNRVAPRGSRLVVGGGATNSDVYATRAANLYFPGGRCPGVGVAGLCLGGGIGFNDRKWGLTCDNLTETRLVVADGSVVRASEQENADLFWACRGGAGGNFGINTGFVFHAVDVSRQRATVFDLTFPLERSTEVMAAVQHILADDERNDFDVRISFTTASQGRAGGMWLLGQRLGDEDGLRRELAPLLALRPATAFVEERHFWDAQDHLMDDPGAPAASASKSLVPTRVLQPHTVQAVTEWIRTWPATEAAGYVTLFAMGGTANGPGPHETAYPHRDATFVIDIGSRWAPDTPSETVDRLLARLRAMHHTLRRDLATDTAYVNFPDPELRDWQHAYYDGNYQRLLTVKHDWDPTGRFRYGQAVGTTG